MQYKEGELCVSGLEKLRPWQSELKHSFLPLVFLKAGFLIQSCGDWGSPGWYICRDDTTEEIIAQVSMMLSIDVFHRIQVGQIPLTWFTWDHVEQCRRGFACQVHDLQCGSSPGSVWSATLCHHQILQSCCWRSWDSLQKRHQKYKGKYAPKPAYISREIFGFHGKAAPRAQGAWKNRQKSLWAGK